MVLRAHVRCRTRAALASAMLAASALLALGCGGGLQRVALASEGVDAPGRGPLPALPSPSSPADTARPAESSEAPGETPADPDPAHETDPAEGISLPSAPGTAAALRYAALDRATCEAELAARGASFERVESARGVVAPIRLRGPLSGVTYRSMLAPAQRRTSPYEILDCRLALALDDLAKVLVKHDVVEVVHYSMYRPPAGKAPLAAPGKRHSGALAIDLGALVTRDGRTLVVEKDFHGGIGQKPCGPRSPKNPSELRALYCEIADAALFNVMLSPDYNWPHRNHFHLEVTAGVRWLLVR
jgi:hypothetical protein